MLTLATILLAALPTEAEGAIYEDTVRLHILAESDSEYDQKMKLLLRDDILSRYGEELSGFKSASDAEAELSLRLCEIEEYASARLKERGYDKEVSVTLGKEFYETRDYGDFSLPAGVYTSLKIVIGEGDGKNWWCVMFPPLCLDAALGEDISYTEAEKGLISGKYAVKFKLLELISSISE